MVKAISSLMALVVFLTMSAIVPASAQDSPDAKPKVEKKVKKKKVKRAKKRRSAKKAKKAKAPKKSAPSDEANEG